MKISMRNLRLVALGAVLAISASAAVADDAANCCYPGSVVYYDEADTIVGVRMFGCGDPGWGVVTSRSKTYNGCIM
ncbi:DUF6289 family protein [Luteimonas soli]|uniref:DUF6289 family protein n=1 Tax=Luteimonas soli TaxID=1648966 RepID=A0ABV7XPH3_9GAMM|nr:DUF6289 family protein [Methylobacterium isbiliense]MDN3628042.1 DUF6289 family protein [Methylobacterium isbiliense]